MHREQIIALTSEEIPYTVAVEINRFREMPSVTRIEATIYVERQSQKGIVIGRGGRMIKSIGSAARLELETLLETRVHLDTRVKSCATGAATSPYAPRRLCDA